ncbi:MAG: ATP-binding protein [Promethearchaeota archaeon]
MKITRLNFKNFMGYKHLNLPGNNEDFPNGLILISGKNSYGKSTILQGILLAFFGPKIFKGRNAASFITYGESKAELYIYFILNNKKYYLYRKWGRTGSASSKLFKMDKLNMYREIKRFDIEKFFEISKNQALSTVFVRQGEVEELANKKGAELREIIINLFRLNIIDDALTFLDKESKSRKIEKSNLEKKRVPIERIEADIQRNEIQNEEFKKIILNNQKQIDQYKIKLKELPAKDLIKQLEKLQLNKTIAEETFLSKKKDFDRKIEDLNIDLKDLELIDKIKSKIQILSDSLNEKKKKKKELEKKKEATSRGLGKTRGRIEDIEKKLKKIKDSINFTQEKNGNQIAICPTCQSELTREHYESIVQNFEKELEINYQKVNKINQLISDCKKEINNYQTLIENLNREIVNIQNLKDDIENIQKYQNELKEAQKSLDKFIEMHESQLKKINLTEIEETLEIINQITAELHSLEEANLQKKEMINVNQKRIVELKEEIKKMKELEEKIKNLEIDLTHIDKSKEFVRRFVTEYMVVKRLIKNIALNTDKYIKDFTSGQYGDLIIDLSGTRKTGLALKIKDNFNGQYEPIEILSGGDRTALGIALRLAISELMGIIRPTKDSPKKNPKIDFLLLDEPLAALDEVRRKRILMHLTKSKIFSQIFLITHTAIPPEIQTHKIIINKDHSTGISEARFEKISYFTQISQ